MNNHLIARAPITGVIIIGRSDTNITGPLIDFATLFIQRAITRPKKSTSGKVIKVNDQSLKALLGGKLEKARK